MSENKTEEIQVEMKKVIEEVPELNQKVKLVALNNILKQLKEMDEKQDGELF